MTLLTVRPGEGRNFGPGLTAKLEYGESPDFAVFQGELPPGSAGPAPHVHRSYDEAFYVLAGSVLFSSEDMSQECPAGSFVFVPRGSVHSFANSATSAAILLVVTSARAILLVESATQLLDDNGRPVDMPALNALMASHDSEVLGPPPPR